MVSIKGRKTHQPMHTVLRPQVATGIVTANPDNHTLQTNLVTRRDIQYLSLVTATFRPAKVHPEKHLSPVLRLRTSSSSMNSQNCIPGVILTGKSHLQFYLVKTHAHLLYLRPNLSLQRYILLLHRHCEQLGNLSNLLLQTSPPLHYPLLLS